MIGDKLFQRFEVTSVETDDVDASLVHIKVSFMPPAFPQINLDVLTMNKLKDHERAVLSAVMFDEGMVPIDNPTHDIGRALATLPNDDARTMKRKFRKAWRKLAKAEARQMNAKKPEIWMGNRFGAGKTNPSRQDRAARKQIVQHHFYEKLVRPILDQFEFGGENGPKGSKLTGEGPT